MRQNISAQYFGAIGLLVLSWRFAPGITDIWQIWVIVGFWSLVATVVLLHAYRLQERTRGPWPAAFLPPFGVTIWLVLFAMAFTLGTPHVRYDDGPTCRYFGWEGAVEKRSDGCPLLALIAPEDGH